MLPDVLQEIRMEVERQNEIHPDGYLPDRNGVRLGLASAEDELREAREAWDRTKKLGHGVDGSRWPEVRAELVQVAGIVVRVIEQMDLYTPREKRGFAD